MINIIDLSHAIYSGASGYPTDPPIVVLSFKDIKNRGCRVAQLNMGTHSGTHVDVPSHIFDDGASLDKLPLASFYGTAIKLVLDKNLPINLDHFRCDGIILETGWGECYNNPELYFSNQRPTLPPNFVDELVKKRIKFFGCDLPSIDKSGEKDKIFHKKFLSKNIVIYENLANLSSLPEGKPFEFFGFPLNLSNADGSPVRAVAFLD